MDQSRSDNVIEKDVKQGQGSNPDGRMTSKNVQAREEKEETKSSCCNFQMFSCIREMCVCIFDVAK